MNEEQAVELFKKKKSNLHFVRIGDYDEKHYVVAALQNENSTDEIDPYYGIDKETGEITPFSPGEDIEKFVAAMGYDDDEDDAENEDIRHSVDVGHAIVDALFS